MTIFKKMIEYVTNLWYSIFRINEAKGSEIMKKVGILDARDLACYIKNKYKEFTQNTKEISPIKMQKALYFCFAYWAGFVNKGKMDEQLPKDTNNILFDNKFEAWAYGPVVPSVYFNEKTAQFFRTKNQEKEAVDRVELILNDNEFLAETLNSIIEDVFEISDFKLVSISHMDMCWKNHFNATEEKHNNEIPKSEIINEYTTKSL